MSIYLSMTKCSKQQHWHNSTWMGNFCGSNWPIKNNTNIKNKYGCDSRRICTDYSRISWNPWTLQICMCSVNSFNSLTILIFARYKYIKVKIFHQSTQWATGIKQTYYFKVKISFTFILIGTIFVKNFPNRSEYKCSLLVNSECLFWSIFSNSVCVTTFSERYNDRVIDICSSCRQSVEDVDIPDTFQL